MSKKVPSHQILEPLAASLTLPYFLFDLSVFQNVRNLLSL